jgi:hypothetical protein
VTFTAITTMAMPSFASSPISQSPRETVRALVVQYVDGYTPQIRVPIPGSSGVSQGMRRKLRLGPALGLNMWRVDFISPVNASVADKVSRELELHPLIVFAEPDGRASATG